MLTEDRGPLVPPTPELQVSVCAAWLDALEPVMVELYKETSVDVVGDPMPVAGLLDDIVPPEKSLFSIIDVDEEFV